MFRAGVELLLFSDVDQVRLRVLAGEASAAAEAAEAPTDEELLRDIVGEMATSALRSTTLALKWSRYVDFPKFAPQPHQPEPLLPVHYDSMVRSHWPLSPGTPSSSSSSWNTLLLEHPPPPPYWNRR